MEKSFWDRVQELKESINGGVEPMESVKLQTRTVKVGLGMYLFQSFVVTMWWSIKDGVFYPWLFFISTFLQVGWFWNKVTDSWKTAYGYRYVRVSENEQDLYTPDSPIQESYYPPTINIQNNGVTGTNSRTVSIPLDMERARDSVIDIGSNESIYDLQNPTDLVVEPIQDPLRYPSSDSSSDY